MSPSDDINTIAQKVKSFFVFDTFGNIAIASFLICAISGIFLAIPFDIKNPFDSIALILLTDPVSSFTRNIHYWSAQLFLVFTLLHIWDHFNQSTEKKVKKGVWLRLTISIPFVFFVMITGFILKGDAESLQALRIIGALFEEIPLIGSLLSYTFFGKEGDFQIIYIHHVATATIFLFIIIFEHVRYIWTKGRTTIFTLAYVVLLSLFFTPGLHDNLNPVVKGPWYYLGLQELLHWISEPMFVILLIAALLLIIYFIPKFSEKSAFNVKKGIVYATLFYFAITLFAYCFRGENYKFVWPWDNPYLAESTLQLFDFTTGISIDELNEKEIPKVLGRSEGCLYCHDGVKGFSPSHDPSTLGCSSCHLGNPFTLNKSVAHQGMILIPGNLSEAKRTCGLNDCHPDIIDRVDKSIMNTMSGIVSVDKFMFGEIGSPDSLFNIANIGITPAESHLRNLCASCHTGNEKTEWGPITELSRGGGCNACHLNYSDEALAELEINKSVYSTGTETSLTKFHPSLSINISNDHCFGCHSRSGRISTNYEGWHETKLEPEDVTGREGFRILEDERVFNFVEADVHHALGLECIDCHISYEVMGDGNSYMHKEEQLIVECADCHLTVQPTTVTVDLLDAESKKILDIRKIEKPDHKFLTGRKGNYPIINTYVDEKENPYLIRKKDKKEMAMKPPIFECTAPAHKDLSCNTCHSAWVPQCVGCHTDYQPHEAGFDLLDNKDTKGSWVEFAGDYFAELPTLGVKILEDENGKEKRVVDTFIPGMIMTIDKSNYPLSASGSKQIFRRVFAPAFSHTIVKRSRDCKSCHNDPLALGYGRGELRYKINGLGYKGIWEFKPKYVLMKQDNLPEDAWIGFMKTSVKPNATRSNSSPFTIEEQKRILTVGACLTCHDDNSSVMKKSLFDFNGLMERLSRKCVTPNF